LNPVAAALRLVLAAFDRLEIRYAVGGSVASSLRGNYRMTNDVDFVVEMNGKQIEEFVGLLGPGFYADRETMVEAFQRRRPCNLIHIQSAFKFDFFPASEGAFSSAQLARRNFEESDFFGETIEFAVLSAEDVLLAKLHWYRLGGESSEQQWRDVQGIVAIQEARLDESYLRRWAKELGVEDLLDRVLG
jgi:hypothetical protein